MVVCGGFPVVFGGGIAGFAVMVGCLWWFAVDFRWFAMVGLRFLIFFLFFSFYVVPNTVKYFSDYFPKCKQTQKKQTFSCKSFAFANILQ